MKNVGIQWIDPIPNHWEVRKIGQMYKERRTKVSDIDYPPLSVTMKGIVPQLATAAKTDAHDDRKLVKKGDFAINSRSDRRGSCGIAQQDGSVSLINTVLCPKKETNPEYLNWLFHTSLFADEFYRWGHGIVNDLWMTNWSDMKRIVIPFPSLPEQSRIATFLDDRCAKIDEAIAKHKALIEKLDEYRKAVITKAVTKGVRGEREMINSNIPWLGSFPSDWEIVKNKDVFSCKKIIVGEKESTTQLLSLTTKGVKTKSKDVVEGKVPQAYDGYQLVNPEQIVMCLFDLDCSAVFAGKSNHVGMVSPAYRVLSCKAGFLPDFADYWFSFVFDKRKYLFYARNLRFTLNYDEFATIPIPCPSPDEQSEIVDFLDKKCAAIDSAKERHQQLIIKLEEYKKSLIYNAVTGKIEC